MRRSDERGAGLLGAVLGVGIAAALLAVAADVAIGLWARTTVDAVAYDAARAMATAPPGVDRQRFAVDTIERAREVLGRTARRTDLRFESLDDTEWVTLRVRSEPVTLLPRLVGGGSLVGGVDRRIVLRREDS